MLRVIVFVLISTGGVAAAQDRAASVPVAGASVVSAAMLPADGSGLRVTVESAIGERLRVFGGGSAGATLVEGAPTIGARFALTTERQDGVATFVGTRYSAAGHEGRAELAVTAAASKHVGAILISGEVDFAREVVEDQRDAELAVAAQRALSRRFDVGVAGHATVDLDPGRADGGEIRWEASGGPTATLHLTRVAALYAQGGASAVATPLSVARGPFALLSLAGWF